MADFNYQLTLEDIGAGLVDLSSDTIKIVLCTADYTADVDADHYLSDIPDGARISTATLSGVDWTAAVFDATDVTFTAPPAGSTITQAVIYQEASPESSGRLIRKISSDTYAGFPFDTNDLDVLLAWPNDAYKSFSFVNA